MHNLATERHLGFAQTEFKLNSNWVQTEFKRVQTEFKLNSNGFKLSSNGFKLSSN